MFAPTRTVMPVRQKLGFDCSVEVKCSAFVVFFRLELFDLNSFWRSVFALIKLIIYVRGFQQLFEVRQILY